MKKKRSIEKKNPLSLEHQQALGSQSITDNEPGSILRDFEMALEFIATHKIKLSPTHNFFGGETLTQLNALMSSPIRMALQRLAPKSYPNINGNYLLMTA